METIIYRKIQDCCYFRIRHDKSNLASNNVEDIYRLFSSLSLCFNLFYALKDSEVLLTPINKVLVTPVNEISHSKKALIYISVYRDLYS